MKAKIRIKKLIYHILVIAFGFVMIYPVLWMISGSFKDNSEILRGSLSLIISNLGSSSIFTKNTSAPPIASTLVK